MLLNHKNAIEFMADAVPTEGITQPVVVDLQSRLSANMPLMLYNCAPLTFLDVARSDYATAMLGVYGQRNVAAAVELFEFIYRRWIQKYSVPRASLAMPEPLRARYRQTLNELMQFVVSHGYTLETHYSRYASIPPTGQHCLPSRISS